MYDCLWIYIPAKLRMKMCIFPIYICPIQNVLSVYDEAHRSMLSLSESERKRSLNLETQFARAVGENERERSSIRAPRDGR